MAVLPRYEMECHITSILESDDGATFTSGQELLAEIYDIDVYDWVMVPFGPFLTEFAPDPSAESVENIQVTLKDYLYPEFFVFVLDIIDEKLKPRRVPTERSPHWPLSVVFDDDFLDDLETWTAFYDPAGIIISHKNPEDALFKPPKKVLIEKGQTACFFKCCHGSVQIIRELKTYKRIHAAGLDSQVNLCHMYGIVMDDNNSILGLLLTHIECGRRLSNIVIPEKPNDPPRALRERWMGRIEAALSALHANDIVWGDVKAGNILIDEKNNALLIDFGGGYTEGWVNKDIAGTVARDFAGMAELKKLVFPST